VRLLFVHSRKASFIAIDRDILAERFEIEDLYQPGRWPNPVKIVRGVVRAEVVFGWFASWHTFFPITLAWLLRKPSVLIIGGFDSANMPEIGYGYQQGGLRRWASRWIMRRAGRLMTFSEYSLSEIARNTPIAPERVTVLHLGVPDPFGGVAPDKERLAVTVGAVDRGTLVQKGQLPFVEAARELPDSSTTRTPSRWRSETSVRTSTQPIVTSWPRPASARAWPAPRPRPSTQAPTPPARPCPASTCPTSARCRPSSPSTPPPRTSRRRPRGWRRWR